MRKVTKEIKEAFEQGKAKKVTTPKQTGKPFGYMAPL